MPSVPAGVERQRPTTLYPQNSHYYRSRRLSRVYHLSPIISRNEFIRGSSLDLRVRCVEPYVAASSPTVDLLRSLFNTFFHYFPIPEKEMALVRGKTEIKVNICFFGMFPLSSNFFLALLSSFIFRGNSDLDVIYSRRQLN